MKNLFLIALILLITQSDSHFRIAYPPARSTDTGIKDPYPCGPYTFWQDGTNKTTLSPGIVTIVLAETINHIGAPYRVAISVGSDNYFDSLVLVDHIPHEDLGSDNEGDTTPKMLMFNVTIPDINCTQCSMQVLDMMTDKITGCCSYPFTNSNYQTCPSVYHSCSDIIITGQMDPMEYLNSFNYTGPCGPYTQQSGTWIQEEDGAWILNPIIHVSNNCMGYQSNCTNRQTQTTGIITDGTVSNTVSSSIDLETTRGNTWTNGSFHKHMEISSLLLFFIIIITIKIF